MYVPKCIAVYLRENYTWEKRKFYYDVTGEHYKFGYDENVSRCEEFMQKLTDAVIKVAKEHNVSYPKEWDTITPLDYYWKKYGPNEDLI